MYFRVMKHWLLFLFILHGIFSYSQLSGKYARFGIDDIFCGEYVYFLNDSLAVTMSGCEAKQFLAFYSFRKEMNDKLVFTYIKKEDVNPFSSAYKTNELEYSRSYHGLGDLVLKYAGDSLSSSTVTTGINWHLMKDSILLSGSGTTENLSFVNLQLTDLCVRFPRLDIAFNNRFCFQPSNFSGEGKVFVLDLIFPVDFLIYQLSYSENDSSFMDFKYENNKLYYLYRGKYELCELESFN